MSRVRNDYHGPDRPDKGVRGGSCNRSACQQSGAIWFNHSTRKYYCEACADWLNTDSFNWADAHRMFGHDLCTLVSASALAAAARQGGDVEQAPGEAPQSGGDSRNAQGEQHD